MSTKRGQPRKYNTEEERLAAKKKRDRKYSKTYHKKVRKKKLANDPEYREKLNRQERLRYRSAKPGFKPKNFGGNAGNAAEFTDIITPDGGVLSVDAIARFLNVDGKVMGQWLESSKFPRPTASAEGRGCYSIEDANALAFVLKRGLANRASFRKTDTEVIAALHQATL